MTLGVRQLPRARRAQVMRPTTEAELERLRDTLRANGWSEEDLDDE